MSLNDQQPIDRTSTLQYRNNNNQFKDQHDTAIGVGFKFKCNPMVQMDLAALAYFLMELKKFLNQLRFVVSLGRLFHQKGKIILMKIISTWFVQYQCSNLKKF